MNPTIQLDPRPEAMSDVPGVCELPLTRKLMARRLGEEGAREAKANVNAVLAKVDASIADMVVQSGALANIELLLALAGHGHSMRARGRIK